MDKKDKKEIKIVMGEVLEEVVLPRFQNIEDKLGEHDKKFEKIEENVEDLQLTTNRIEMKLDAGVKRHNGLSLKFDQLDKRVLKIETKS